MTHPRLGFTYASLMSLGPVPALDTARRATGLGYSSFWTAETTGTEAFSLLGAVGSVAPDLGLGTGVLALQLRTPMLAAMGAATLQTLHPDVDVILGIGISSPVVAGNWHGTEFGTRPLAQVREYITLVRACLTGERVDFDGDFYRVKGFRLGLRLPTRTPKIVLGALGPEMLKLGGDVADGVLLNYLSAGHVGWSVDQIRAGGDAEIYAYIHAGVGDPESGREKARRDLFSYAVVDAYAANFTRDGFADEVEEIRAAHAARDREAALAAVSDRMCDAIDLIGTHDQVRDRVRAYVDAGVQVPVLMPMPWGGDRTQVLDDTMVAAAEA